MISAPILLVPPAEFESAAFCSASKRSIQLSYEGKGTVPAYYTPAGINRQGMEIEQPPIFILSITLKAVQFSASLYKKAANVYTSAGRSHYITGHRLRAISGQD